MLDYVCCWENVGAPHELTWQSEQQSGVVDLLQFCAANHLWKIRLTVSEKSHCCPVTENWNVNIWTHTPLNRLGFRYKVQQVDEKPTGSLSNTSRGYDGGFLISLYIFISYIQVLYPGVIWKHVPVQIKGLYMFMCQIRHINMSYLSIRAMVT